MVSFVPVISVLIRMLCLPVRGSDSFSHPSGASVALPAWVTDLDCRAGGLRPRAARIVFAAVQHWPFVPVFVMCGLRGLIRDGVEAIPTNVGRDRFHPVTL